MFSPIHDTCSCQSWAIDKTKFATCGQLLFPPIRRLFSKEKTQFLSQTYPHKKYSHKYFSIISEKNRNNLGNTFQVEYLAANYARKKTFPKQNLSVLTRHIKLHSLCLPNFEWDSRFWNPHKPFAQNFCEFGKHTSVLSERKNWPFPNNQKNSLAIILHSLVNWSVLPTPKRFMTCKKINFLFHFPFHLVSRQLEHKAPEHGLGCPSLLWPTKPPFSWLPNPSISWITKTSWEVLFLDCPSLLFLGCPKPSLPWLTKPSLFQAPSPFFLGHQSLF